MGSGLADSGRSPFCTDFYDRALDNNYIPFESATHASQKAATILMQNREAPLPELFEFSVISEKLGSDIGVTEVRRCLLLALFSKKQKK